jgi:2',3'-cyclic-nucleotide 2'-phosphodiesterase (5'-nucleotidase family)
VIGATVRSTPELVRADATEGLEFLDEAERVRRESEILRRHGVRVQVVVIHEGAVKGANPVDGKPAEPWEGPIVNIVERLRGSTIDLVVAGHTHRNTNTIIGGIPVVEGLNAGGSYSVAQLMVSGSDVVWAGTAVRTAKNLGVASRADVQAIVDQANAETAELRNQVIGRQQGDIRRDPTRLNESAMGNLVADAMLGKYPGVEAALTNSGGLRADIVSSPPSAGEAPGEITWGEVFAVLPFGNRTTILTLHGRPVAGSAAERVQPGVQHRDRDRPLPTGGGAQARVPLRRHHARGGFDVPGAGRGTRDPDRPGRHDPHRHQRLHAHRRRRLHRACGRHRRPHAGRRPARGDDRVHRRELAGRPGGGGTDRQAAGILNKLDRCVRAVLRWTAL